MAGMKWTKEIPMESGWYWIKESPHWRLEHFKANQPTNGLEIAGPVPYEKKLEPRDTGTIMESD